MSNTQPAIEVQNLTKTYQPRGQEPVKAVQDLDLTIAPGEVVSFLGPNGAGKSTTLDMILGLTNPTSGTVSILGQSPRHAIKAGQITAVLQSGGLLMDLSVRETLRLVASTYSLKGTACTQRVDEVIARVGLGPIAKRRVSKCSGGEQQKLRYALALLPDPAIIILDEPTAGMDVSARRTFWADMHTAADDGQTIVFATHYLHEAEEFADRTIVISSGRIVADGPTSTLRRQFASSRLSAHLPADQADAAIATLKAATTLDTINYSHNKITVTASSTDDVAKTLLTQFDACDLEITRGSLDDVFINLTDSNTTKDVPA